MQTSDTYVNGQITQTSINLGAFDQRVMSVDGDVTIAAGGHIINVAAAP